MEVSVTDAKGQLTDLIRRAEAGDEVILTQDGQAVALLIPIKAVTSPAVRRKLSEAMRAKAAAKVSPGPDPASSQDFLYGKEGLPE